MAAMTPREYARFHRHGIDRNELQRAVTLRLSSPTYARLVVLAGHFNKSVSKFSVQALESAMSEMLDELIEQDPALVAALNEDQEALIENMIQQHIESLGEDQC